MQSDSCVDIFLSPVIASSRSCRLELQLCSDLLYVTVAVYFSDRTDQIKRKEVSQLTLKTGLLKVFEKYSVVQVIFSLENVEGCCSEQPGGR